MSKNDPCPWGPSDALLKRASSRGVPGGPHATGLGLEFTVGPLSRSIKSSLKDPPEHYFTES